MGNRIVTFEPGEWYHCFTRGVDKRQIFLSVADYERYLMLLYACNSTEPIHVSNMGTRHQGPALTKVLACERGHPLVDIGAYCLMPNHSHLLLREVIDGGVSLFMQKVGTGYTMFFNKKYERIGTLFSSRFKALHIGTDQYLQRAANYIHANAAELYEPRWKDGIVQDRKKLKEKLLAYQFSSLLDYEYENVARPHKSIINVVALSEVLDQALSFETLMEEAEIYCRSNKGDLKGY